jgi:Holliday junction resolvase
VSKSRAKGTRFESEVVEYLKAHGFPHAERRAMHGTMDKGDIAGVAGVVIECKAEQSITLSEYMDEVADEVLNAGARCGVAVVKRRRRGVSEAYVIQPLEQWVKEHV